MPCAAGATGAIRTDAVASASETFAAHARATGTEIVIVQCGRQPSVPVVGWVLASADERLAALWALALEACLPSQS